MVRQCPCGAKARRRFPFGPQPRIGAMLVLIQVSSMNTRRSGSSRPCQAFQRRRRWAIITRARSRANSVFFEAQSLAPEKPPHRLMRYDHASCCQDILQTMQGQMRRPLELFDDEITMRLKNPFAMSAHLARRNAPRRTVALAPLHNRRNRHAKSRRHRATTLTSIHS